MPNGGEWSASCHGRLALKKIAWYPFIQGPDGPKCRSGRFGEEKNLLPLVGSEPLIVLFVAQSVYPVFCYVDYEAGA
jgi:hypothetical protein